MKVLFLHSWHSVPGGVTGDVRYDNYDNYDGRWGEQV
jgi:hypothetical protein